MILQLVFLITFYVKMVYCLNLTVTENESAVASGIGLDQHHRSSTWGSIRNVASAFRHGNPPSQHSAAVLSGQRFSKCAPDTGYFCARIHSLSPLLAFD